ncbi:hypothetical protein ABKV19_000158, partial [Rosa sericea]
MDLARVRIADSTPVTISKMVQLSYTKLIIGWLNYYTMLRNSIYQRGSESLLMFTGGCVRVFQEHWLKIPEPYHCLHICIR